MIGAAGVDVCVDLFIHALPHHRLWFWLCAQRLHHLRFSLHLSPSDASLSINQQQYQLDLLFSLFCDIRQRLADDVVCRGTRSGVALSPSLTAPSSYQQFFLVLFFFSSALRAAAMLYFVSPLDCRRLFWMHGQHLLELLLSLSCEIRLWLGSGVFRLGALFGVALSLSLAELSSHQQGHLALLLSSSVLCAAAAQCLVSPLDSRRIFWMPSADWVGSLLSDMALSLRLLFGVIPQTMLTGGRSVHQQQQLMPPYFSISGLDSPATSALLGVARSSDLSPPWMRVNPVRSRLSLSRHLDFIGSPIKVRASSLLQASKVVVNEWHSDSGLAHSAPDFSAVHSFHSGGAPASTSLTVDNPSLGIYFQNMSGMRTKATAVFLATSHGDHDVIALVETWLNMDFFDNEFFDSNLYQVFRKDRDAVKTQCSRGGGVLIAVRRSLRCASIRLLNDDSLLDQICVSLAGPIETIFLVVSYIPPSSSFELYKAHVDNIAHIQQNLEDSQYICVLGDFNLSSLVWVQDVDSSAMVPSNLHLPHEILVIDDLFSMGLVQMNNVFNKLNKLLDLIFVSPDLNINLVCSDNPLSECDAHHQPLILSILTYIFAPYKPRYTQIYINASILNSIRNDISRVNWVEVLSHASVDTCYERFLISISAIIRSHAKKRFQNSYSLPWYTRGLKKYKNLRNKFYKRFVASGNSADFARYKQHKREFEFLNKFLYNQYIADVERKLAINPKSFWHFVNSKRNTSYIPSSMSLNNVSASTDRGVANLFANYFASNFEPHALWNDEVTLSAIASTLNIGCLYVSELDCHNAAESFNNSEKLDCDGLSPFILKNCIGVLSEPLQIIFNKSLTSGVFSSRWKLASVTPIFKSGVKSIISNYRPIAKLSNVSKLFERIIAKQLSFLVAGTISPNQHGFMPGRSTTTNLAVFNHFCIHSFLSHYQVDVVYTDFAKAFDKVCHNALLAKLKKIGFHSFILNWIRSYLNGRMYRVECNSYFSSPYLATSGLPQGSALGPLLFILFINDIGNQIKNSEFLLFADDLKVFKSVNSVLDSEFLQNDLCRIGEWCSRNALPLNLSKCFTVTYSKRHNNLLSSYSINSNNLPCKNEALDLGVMFDTKFLFIDHINYIVPKAYAMYGFIKRNTAQFSDPYTLLSLFFSFVRSKLEYASFIWNPTGSIHIHRLERIQKKFLSYALKSLNFSHPVPSYPAKCRLVHLSTLQDRRTAFALIFIFDLITAKIDCPSLLSRVNFAVPGRHLRDFEPFYIPVLRTNYALNEPLCRALIFYNSLPPCMRLDPSSPRDLIKKALLHYLRS